MAATFFSFLMKQPQMSKDWNQPLISLDEPGTLATSFLCPCVQFAKNKQKLNNTESILPDAVLYCCSLDFICCGLTGLLGMSIRSEIREKSEIRGSKVGDFCTHLFCYPFALSQESAQLDILKEE
jgi:Cys-rich protein (TIGR01571 family)